ncbi:hypothetical protein ACVIGA_008295 [Bradyrhizobium sp. USDA 3240]
MSALLLERDRRVLRDIIAIIRPRGSLAAKLETLTDEQRAHYEYYSERMSAFIARNDIDPDGNPGNAYAMT